MFLCYDYYGDNMDIKIDNIEDVDKKKFNWKKCFLIILCIIFCCFLVIVYSRYRATSGLKVYEYKITDSNLPDSFHGVKLVQFSDLYFGNTVDINYLKRIVSSINKLKPDIVVFTGDLINKDVDGDTKNKIIDLLGSINSSIGKYAISGDSDNSLFNDIITASNFICLDNNSVEVYYKGDVPIVIGNKDVTSDLFNVLLIHKPDDVDNITNSFNLILAGHSLNGQINIPFIKKLFLQDGAKKYYNGFYNINDSLLYVSNGIGTTSFKYRFNNRPSISLFRLTKY